MATRGRQPSEVLNPQIEFIVCASADPTETKGEETEIIITTKAVAMGQTRNRETKAQHKGW